jgi:hypothetical protein
MIRLQIRVAERTYRVKARWVGEGWPADVRAAIASIPDRWPRDQLVVADQLSPGALELLQERDANWADGTGRTRILVPPGLAVVREPARRRAAPEAPPKFRWSPSAVAIVETLLHDPEVRLRTRELSARTEWSVPQVSKVLRALDSQGWTIRHGPKRGWQVQREIKDRGALLDAWAAAVGNGPRRKRLGHVVARDLLRFAHTQLAEALGGDGKDWALTTWAGLELLAPFVTAVPALHIYVAADRFASSLDDVFRAAGIREVEEGARIEFWEADVPLITQPGGASGLPVCSAPRLYADLLALGGRATEAALHLRTVALGY